MSDFDFDDFDEADFDIGDIDDFDVIDDILNGDYDDEFDSGY